MEEDLTGKADDAAMRAVRNSLAVNAAPAAAKEESWPAVDARADEVLDATANARTATVVKQREPKWKHTYRGIRHIWRL